ncbi:MAG: AAA family ATPase [Gammaproteobacteria bacterium]|nr:AAA family ATPase [Gammaproteobacteria bacterium]
MYLDAYNFSARPFQLTPDLRFLFPSRSHKRALSYLRFGLEQAEGFVVITGHIGTGKTMLIQTLLAEMADQEIATARIAAANLNEENVLSAVAASLNLPYEGKSKVAIMANLEKSLRHARDRVSSVMLIVDEAQTLSPEALEELRILSNLDSQGRALMQIFLVGQTELRVTLQARRMEQLRQRIVASYHLEPLSPEETKRYIGFRLVAVGWNGDPSFSNEVYGHIYEASGGIPRKVNIVMDRLLLYGYLEEIRDFEEEHIVQVIEEMSQELSGDLLTKVEDTSIETTEQPKTKSELEERLRQLESKLDDLVGAAGTG